eukprot:4805289-Amphidinium_carterae.1
MEEAVALTAKARAAADIECKDLQTMCIITSKQTMILMTSLQTDGLGVPTKAILGCFDRARGWTGVGWGMKHKYSFN